MTFPLISFLTESWHLLDVSAVVGHGAVLAVLLFYKILRRITNSEGPLGAV